MKEQKFRILIQNNTTKECKVSEKDFLIKDLFLNKQNNNLLENEEIKDILLGLNILDKNKKEIFNGDILKLEYKDASSKIFEKMKSMGVTELFFAILPDENNLFSYLISSDYKNFFISPLDDCNVFMRYLSGTEKIEIVGNYYTDKEFYLKNFKDKDYYDKQYFEEKVKNIRKILDKDINVFFDLEELKENVNSKNQTKNFVDKFKAPLIDLKNIEIDFNMNINKELIININIDFDIDFETGNIGFEFTDKMKLDVYKNYFCEIRSCLITDKEFKRKKYKYVDEEESFTLNISDISDKYFVQQLPEKFLFTQTFKVSNY